MSAQPNIVLVHGAWADGSSWSAVTERLQADGYKVTGVVDWSEASPGDALFDLATLTVGHQEHLGDVIAGYGTDVDLDLIHAWWSLRCLLGVRWLVEHGYGPPEEYPEVAVLRSRL